MDSREDENGGQNSSTETTQETQNTSTTTTDGGLQSGINYCKYLSEQMQNEVVTWEKKLDDIRQTTVKLRQNVIDLDTEKQKMIMNFQEEFRKYNMLNNYVTELDEEVQIMKNFLENTVGVENDIGDTEAEERRIRILILKTFDDYSTEFRIAHSKFLNEKTRVQKKWEYINGEIEKKQACEKINADLEMYIGICEKKIQERKLLLNETNTDEAIKKMIHATRTETETTVAEFKERNENLSLQVEEEINLLRSRFQLLQERMQKVCTKITTGKEEIKLKLQTLVTIHEDLTRELTERNTTIEKLKAEKEETRVSIVERLKKVENLNTEIKTKTEILKKHLASVEKMEYKQREQLKFQEARQEQIRLAKLEKDKLQNHYEEFEKLNSLMTKYEDLKRRKMSLVEAGYNLDKTLEGLSAKNNQIFEGLDEFKNCIREEEELISKLKAFPEENQTNAVYDSSEDLTVLENQLAIEVEENSLNELYEVEMNSLHDKLLDIVSKYADSEMEVSQIEQDNQKLQEKLQEKPKSLKSIKAEFEFCKTSIQSIKQNVYQGKYVTMQQLNKKLNAMVNGKNIEMERVEKLKTEINNLQNRLNAKNAKQPQVETEKRENAVQPKSRKMRKISSININEDMEDDPKKEK